MNAQQRVIKVIVKDMGRQGLEAFFPEMGANHGCIECWGTLMTYERSHQDHPGPGALDAILSHLVSSICAELAQQLLPALVQTLDKTIGTAALEIATRPANPIVEVDVSTASAQTSAAVSKAARVDAPIVMPKAPPKFAHFKVAIVGLRGDQVAMIKSEYGGNKLDLRFIDGAKNCAADIRVASNQCDHVVAMLDFVSHSDSDVARAGTAKYIGLHGGMSTLRNKLNDIVLAHETRIAAVAA
ncbi:MAG: hypothetical protein Q7U48_13700 [Hydrogenophaga sp.]|nr:hypothetical protein [Hydrogenophaga sp.]